jgi:hypothetical protein
MVFCTDDDDGWRPIADVDLEFDDDSLQADHDAGRFSVTILVCKFLSFYRVST